MKSLMPLTLRSAAGLAVAVAALLSASGAFAQAAPPSYNFDVENDTFSSGDPVFSVTDNLTFTNLKINEVFQGGFTQTILLGSLDTNTFDAYTNSFTSSAPLISATLTGSIGPGPAQTINTATTFGGPTMPQYVSSSFSASLFGPNPTGPALGQFALVSGNNVVNTVNIIAPAAVPEASTTVSLGFLLALGLGGVAVSRRRAASAAK